MRVTGRIHYPTVYNVYLETRQTCWFYPSPETLLLVLAKIEKLINYQNLSRADKLTTHILPLSYKYEHKGSQPIESTIYPNPRQYKTDKLDISFYTCPKRYTFELPEEKYRRKFNKTLAELVKLSNTTVKVDGYYISSVSFNKLANIDKLFISNYGTVPLFYELDKKRIVIPYARNPHIPNILETADYRSIIIPCFESKRLLVLPEIQFNYSNQKLIAKLLWSFTSSEIITVQNIKYPKQFEDRSDSSHKEYATDYKLNTAYRTYPILLDKRLRAYENVYSFLTRFGRLDWYNIDQYSYLLTFSTKNAEITEKTLITARDIVAPDSKNWLQSRLSFDRVTFTLTIRLFKRSNSEPGTKPVSSNSQSEINSERDSKQSDLSPKLQIRELSKARREIITNILEATYQSTALFDQTKLVKHSLTSAIKKMVDTIITVEKLDTLSVIPDILYEFESSGLRVIITSDHIYVITNEEIFRIRNDNPRKWHLAYKKSDLAKIILIDHCEWCKVPVAESSFTTILIHLKKRKAISITRHSMPVNPEKLGAILKHTRYYVYNKTPLFQPIDGQVLYENLESKNDEVPSNYNKFHLNLKQSFSLPYLSLNYDNDRSWYISVITFILPDILKYKIKISTNKRVEIVRDNVRQTLTLREVPFITKRIIKPNVKISGSSLNSADSKLSQHETKMLKPTGYLLAKTYKGKTPVILKLNKNELNITAQRYTYWFKSSLQAGN